MELRVKGQNLETVTATLEQLSQSLDMAPNMRLSQGLKTGCHSPIKAGVTPYLLDQRWNWLGSYIALYVSETWSLTEELEKRKQACEMRLMLTNVTEHFIQGPRNYIMRMFVERSKESVWRTYPYPIHEQEMETKMIGRITLSLA